MTVIDTNPEAISCFDKDHPVQYVYEFGWQCCNCKRVAGMSDSNLNCPDCDHYHCVVCVWEKIEVRASESRSKVLATATPARLPKSEDQTLQYNKSPPPPESSKVQVSKQETHTQKGASGDGASQLRTISQSLPISACSQSPSEVLATSDHPIGSQPINELSRPYNIVARAKTPISDTTVYEDLFRIVESAVASLLKDHLALAARPLPRMFHLANLNNENTLGSASGLAGRARASERIAESGDVWEQDCAGFTANGSTGNPGNTSPSNNSGGQVISTPPDKQLGRQSSLQKRDRSPDGPDKPEVSPSSKKPRRYLPRSSTDFACHFHKRYPDRYLTHRRYRECAKASIPQERLSRITSVDEESTSLGTKQLNQCRDHYKRNHPFEQDQGERIADAMRRRGRSDFDKWFDIWDILFPGVQQPTTPWNEPPKPPLPTPEAYRSALENLIARSDHQGIVQSDPDVFRYLMDLACQAFEEVTSSGSNQIAPRPNIPEGGGQYLENQTRIGTDSEITTSLTSLMPPPQRRAGQKVLLDVPAIEHQQTGHMGSHMNLQQQVERGVRDSFVVPLALIHSTDMPSGYYDPQAGISQQDFPQLLAHPAPDTQDFIGQQVEDDWLLSFDAESNAQMNHGYSLEHDDATLLDQFAFGDEYSIYDTNIPIQETVQLELTSFLESEIPPDIQEVEMKNRKRNMGLEGRGIEE